MPRLTLRWKLLLFSVAIAVVPILVAARTMIRIGEDELKSSANEQLLGVATELTREVNDVFERSWLDPLILIRNAIDDDRLGVQEKIALLTLGLSNIPDIVALQITLEGADLPLLVTKDEFSQNLRTAGLDPLATLRTTLLLLAGFVRQHQPLLQRLVADAAAGHAVVHHFLRDNAPRHLGLLMQLLQAAQQAGRLPGVESPLAGAVFLMGAVVAPLLVALVMAYLLEWPVSRLQRGGLSRTVATSLVLLLFITVTTLMVLGLIPTLVSQGVNLAKEAPSMLAHAQDAVRTLPEKYPEIIDVSLVETIIDNIRQRADE